jgi:predicted ABC-type ATPase
MREVPLGVLQDAALQTDRVLIVLAGPNGAGKSTFFEVFLASTGIHFVNADLIARTMDQINPAAVAYEAAGVADAERRRLIAEGTSFCMETVFSDPVGDKRQFLQEARNAGYTVFLVFIGIDSPELSIGRIIQRVEDGGHDVPDEKIRERFPRTLANLRQAVEFVDYAYLFDNSSYDEPYRLLATFEHGHMTQRTAMLPDWTKDVPGFDNPFR